MKHNWLYLAPHIQKIEEELQGKQKQHDKILAIVNTLLVLQKLASINEGKNLEK